MSTYVGKLLSAVSSAFEVNAATLTGAMDIIAVVDADGNYSCTPFHVRFGKLKLLKSREKVVEVWVNDVKTELTMKLGSAGEAYFVIETDELPEPDMLPSPPNEPADGVSEPMEYRERGVAQEVVHSERIARHDQHAHRISKDDMNLMSPSAVMERSAYGYLSDSEAEVPNGGVDPRWSRFSWRDMKEDKGNRPTTAKHSVEHCGHRSSEGGVSDEYDFHGTIHEFVEYVVDEAVDRHERRCRGNGSAWPGANQSDPNILAKKRDESRQALLDKTVGVRSRPENLEEQVRKEPTVRPLQKRYSVVRELSEASGLANVTATAEDYDGEEDRLLAFSNCRHLLTEQMSDGDISNVFESNRISYAEFATNPNLLYNPNLLFRLQDRLVDWKIAAPMIISMLAFGVPLDMDRLEKAVLAREREAALQREREAKKNRGSYWFGFRRSTPVTKVSASEADHVVGNPLLEDDASQIFDDQPFYRKAQSDTATGSHLSEALGGQADSTEEHMNAGLVLSTADSLRKKDTGTTFSEEGIPKFVRKSLRPSAEQLADLPLKPGVNTITFVVVYNNQRVSSRIFLWPSDSKIVVSDVDGTITRSDVLGHLLPRVGRDWSQAGVAGLYTKILSCGYHVMYLTSRPIGQAGSTRLYLDSLCQGDGFHLPEGPIVMSPDRLVKSITREMIQRRPHDFKISALHEIREMWPEDYNPFYAGFGNRITDSISYQSVGIPISRIFTVNSRGELTVMNTTYDASRSYTNLRSLVDCVFPDIANLHGRDAVQEKTGSGKYNSRNFWKVDLPAVDFSEIQM